VFVIFAVTVLSLAAGAGLLAQLGLAVWWAMVGALAIYAALLTLHLVARRSFAALDEAATDRLQAQIDALMLPPGGNESPHQAQENFAIFQEPGSGSSRAAVRSGIAKFSCA